MRCFHLYLNITTLVTELDRLIIASPFPQINKKAPFAGAKRYSFSKICTAPQRHDILINVEWQKGNNMLPKSINIISIHSNDSVPTLTISGDCLFDSNFLPGQPLQAEIYDGKIIITPCIKDNGFAVIIKQ